MEPKAYRPLHHEYLTVGYILRYGKNFIDMTEQEFVNSCMFYSHGAMNPNQASKIYKSLMQEAGL
jgi:hypothetical protein